MSTAFEFPEWLVQAPPPTTPSVDDHRVEALVNRFIAGKQDALFTAPDAFYRREGADAVEGRPAIADRLQALRAATLDLARDDGERAALAPRLDLHIDDAMDGIDRHVAEQRRVHQRQVISERQALIRRAAELEHDNDDKITGLAEANASAAAERARLDGVAPDSPEAAAAVLGARSSIFRTAIGERIANGKGAQALALFDRVEDRLAPADRLSLDTPVLAARNDDLANQWIDRERNTDGPPLQERVAIDPELTPDARAIVRAKIDARESADESARAARVDALDDENRSTFQILSTKTEAYTPGTFARLADAYDAAGEPQKAADARQLALQESFLLAFAQATPDRQQKLIDLLPAQDRPAAQSIQRDQSEEGAQDGSRPSIALGTDVGPHLPAGGVGADLETERLLDAIYAVDQPGHASEPADAEEPSALLHQVQAVGDNDRQGKAAEKAEVERLKRIDPDARMVTQIRVYVEGGPDYMVADIIVRGNGVAVVNITEVKSGSAVLTDNQMKALAQAARNGGVYITNAEAAKTLKIETHKTLGAQQIIPEVYVTGGDTEKIMRQMRNQGVDVRPSGVRGRLRIVGPPL
jgi:hypothetical protein